MEKTMVFYYPIPAGAIVTCQYCNLRMRDHLDAQGGWRGCPIGADGNREDGMQEVIAGAHPVWLVSAERRATDRRNGHDRRGAGGMAVPVHVIEHNGDGQPTAVRTSMPSALGVGTRKAVYVAVPGAQLSGTAGQAAKVFAAIAGAEQHGKTAEELRKELKLKAKSLESALYRLKLAGVVRAFNFADVRARS